MKNFAKKLCSITLALCVILSAVFVLPVSAADIADLQLDTPMDVTVENGESAEVYFTPDESGVYEFHAEGAFDLRGYISDSDGNEITQIYGGERLFLRYYLTGGTTYIFGTYAPTDDPANYTIKIVDSNIVSLDVEDVTVYEGLDNYLSSEYNYDTWEWEEYQRYEFRPNLTLNLRDGNVIESGWEGGLELEDAVYYLATSPYDTQGPDNEWEVGKTYTVKGSLFGMEKTFNVTVESNPVVSFEIEDVVLDEGIGLYPETYYPEEGDPVEWESYNLFPKIKVALNGGDVLEGNRSVHFNNKYYEVQFSGEQYQSYTNPWQAGNTYPVTATLMGFSNTFNVTIQKSPIDSVVFDDITVVEYFDSETRYDYNEDTGEYDLAWQYYQFLPSFTVYLSDGRELQFENNWVEIDGKQFGFEYENYQDPQSYENHWLPGETYTVKGDFAGFEVEFDVTVEESPVVSVNVEDVSIYEGEYYNVRQDQNEETGEWETYWAYSVYPNFSVTLEGGAVIENSGGGIIYNDTYYWPDIYDDQSATNQWGAGEHTATLEIFGVSAEFTINILEFPIKSISVEPLSIQEDTNGWWSDVTDEEGNTVSSYYRYQWYDEIEIDVEFSDGTTQTYGLWDEVTYGDNSFNFGWDDTQSYDTPWVAGNTYTSQVWIHDVSANVEVTITEAPYKSIEILSVEPLRESDYDWISESGNKIYSTPNFTYKITLESGDSFIREGNFWYEDHEINISHDQYENPWTVGGENIVTVSIGKAVTTFNVQIIEVADWEYIEQGGGLFITNCNIDQEEVTVPSEIDGKPVVGIMSMGELYNTYTLTLPYSISSISDEAFYEVYNLNTLNINSNVTLDPDKFCELYCLSEINVSENNENYTTIDGVVYNKDGDTLVVYPLGRGTYYIPDNVVNVDVLFEKEYYAYISVEFGENSKALKKVDGITYNADMSTVIKCDPEKTGSYKMPSSVTSISASAFSGSSLSEITVSDNVSEIVYNTFSYCNNLESIALPDAVKSIGDCAFTGSNLKNLKVLPSKLTTIGDNAFADTQLQSIIIQSNVTEIGYNAFGWSMLEKVSLYEGLEYIGDCAFIYTELESITIPNTVEYIGWSAFEGTYITEVKIPDSVTYLGDFAFAYTPLKKFTLSSELESISNGVFAGTLLTEVVLPENIVYVGNNAFSDCPITKLEFKADNVTLGDNTFSGNAMTDIVIPDSVTDITYYSFAHSENLESIDIPDNIWHIDGHAFDGTKWYDVQDNGVIYLENALYGYKGNIVEDTELEVKNGTTVIADYAFDCGPDFWTGEYVRDFSGLKSVVLPNTVKTIGDYAFLFCTGLEKIVIPESVVNFGYMAFFGCDNLTIHGYAGSAAEIYANQNDIPFVAMVEKETNDVKVSAPAEVIDQNAQLIVETLDEVKVEEIVSKIPEEVTFTNIKVLDIYFELDGDTIQPNGTVTVEVAVPEEFNGKYCDVFHIDDDGTMTDMNATYTNGKLTFSTNHFSNYAIIEDKPAFVYGNVDNDENNDIDNRDLAELMQYINGWDIEINTAAADVIIDDSIDNIDYAHLMQYVNGWDVSLGITLN